MSLQVEKLEKSTAKLTVEVPAEQFAKAIQNAYNKNRGRYSIPGFRKGKAPFQMIKKMYGIEMFFEDAANEVIDATYPVAIKESGLDIMSRPSVNVTKIAENEPMVYEATVAIRPEVKLGEYKGVEVKKADATVTDADVDAEIEREREKNSRLVTIEDRAVEDGDQVTIDFDGYIDGKQFEGGKSEDYPLTIGSHSFIDNFEEQLIGKKTGDECEVNVTFPENYQVEELKGKPAVFKVKIKEIQKKELPEVNDEFASEVSDFETLAEYKEDIRKKLTLEKQKTAASLNEDHVVEKVVENATMEISDQLIDEQADSMLNDYARQLQSQGIDFSRYLQITGLTVEKMAEQMKPQAERRVRTRLVLEKVVKAENIEVGDDAVEAEFDKMAASYKMEKDQLKSMFGEEQISQMKQDLAVQEAIDFLVAEAKLTD